jgi:hypothetical protein
MTEHMNKQTLLDFMNTGYTSFTELLASLSEQQLTTPGVNSTWSAKDNIAHLSAWQKRTLPMVQAVRDNVDFIDPLPDDATEEGINEQFYQQNKDRSLADVLAELHMVHRQFVENVQAMSDEELNRPLSWRSGRPIWPWIHGNSGEHYNEHMKIIRDWFARSQDAERR